MKPSATATACSTRKPIRRFLQTGAMLSLMAAGLLVLPGAAHAQDTGGEKAKPAPNALMGGGGWQAEVTPVDPGDSVAINEDHKALLQRINAYLKNFNDLEGRFIQTNPNNAVQKGKFYVLRPGRVRFDYARPSRLRVVANGKYLTVEDHDLKTSNSYPLESTPFRMLLKKDIDLERDAVILGISTTDNSATLTLADKSGQSAGRIQLFFSLPEIELKEWVMTDAQGLNTRIEISDLTYNRKLASNLFEPSKVGLAKAFGEN